MNKKKILNDPVYGFINIPNELIFDIIEHPYFQRLRRIKQLGLTDYVYPGAQHTRFHHAIGAMHLMDKALASIESKGHKISEEEYNAALVAILLHDVGHGPFSHTLEFSLLNGVSHEQLSLRMMQRLNEEMSHDLGLAIEMFQGKYHRPFFHQLISSQLDLDRLDYLKRDSFFTGVHEGMIGSERIIKMLEVVNDEIVVEEKGIYSIENFLNARRLMYWQVYLHKVAVSAEVMLIEIVKRAKELAQQGVVVQATPALSIFLERNITTKDFEEDEDIIQIYSLLDDGDIWGSLKFWQNHNDFALRTLSEMLLHRKLFKIEFSNEEIDDKLLNSLNQKVAAQFKIDADQAQYFVKTGAVSNSAYIATGGTINILKKTGELVDVAEATDLPNIKALSQVVKKNYLCAPKSVFGD